jgi:ABC-type microcin C transport system permease subunit YejB
VDAIKEKYNSFNDIIDFDLIKEIEANYNLDEPFAWLFYWMFKNFSSAEFSDIDSTDGTSTIINVNKKPMLIHSWYSRMYDKDVDQTERINKCIEWAIIQKMQP